MHEALHLKKKETFKNIPIHFEFLIFDANTKKDIFNNKTKCIAQLIAGHMTLSHHFQTPEFPSFELYQVTLLLFYVCWMQLCLTWRSQNIVTIETHQLELHLRFEFIQQLFLQSERKIVFCNEFILLCWTWHWSVPCEFNTHSWIDYKVFSSPEL